MWGTPHLTAAHRPIGILQLFSWLPRVYESDTIGDMAARARDEWLWASCPLPCGHTAALPIPQLLKRAGHDLTADALLRRLSG